MVETLVMDIGEGLLAIGERIEVRGYWLEVKG